MFSCVGTLDITLLQMKEMEDDVVRCVTSSKTWWAEHRLLRLARVPSVLLRFLKWEDLAVWTGGGEAAI